MATPNEIIVRIITDLAALKSGMSQAGGIIAGAASKAQGLSSALGNIERGARAAGIQLALIGGAGTAAFGSAAKSAVDFEKNMALIVALTGVQKEEIAGLTEKMKPLAITTGITLNDMAQAFYFAASAVSDTDTAFDILKASAYASAGGLGDLTIVVDAVSSAVNAYANSNLTAAHATDVIIQTVRDGKAEPEALAGSFGRVLPVASAMGLTFEEVGANLAIMTRVGMSADEASTALKATLTQMLKPSTEARDLLASMGMTFDDVRKSISERGLLATLNDLIAATGGNVDQLAILFPNVRALTDVLGSAVAQGDAYAQVLDNMNTSAGATTDAFNTMAGTNAMNIARLKAMISVLSVEIGTILLPTVYEMTDALQTFVSRLRELSQEHPGLTKFVVIFGAIASVVTLVAGGFLLFVSAAAGGIKALVDLYIGLSKAAPVVWNLAKGLAQAAIDAGTFAVKMALAAWDTLATSIGTAARNVWDYSRGLHDAMTVKPQSFQQMQGREPVKITPSYVAGANRGSLLKGSMEGAGRFLGGAVTGAGVAAGPKIASAVTSSLSGLGATLAANPIILAIAGAIILAIIAGFFIWKYRKQIWAGLVTVFDILRDFFTQTLPQWFKENFTAHNLGTIFGWVAVALIVAMFPIPLLILHFRHQILGFLETIPGFVASIPGKIAGFVGDHWFAILFALFPIEMAIVKWHKQIEDFLGGIMTFVISIPGRIAAFVGDHWRGILFAIFPVPVAIIKWHEQIEQWLGSIVDFVVGIPGRIASFIGDHWKEIIGGIIDVPKWSVEFGDKATSFVADLIPKIPGFFAGIGTAIAQAIKDAFLAMIDFGAWIKTGFAAFWSKVPGPVKDFFGGVGGPLKKLIDWAFGEKGLVNFAGGMAWVGEHGPELLKLPRGSSIIRNENTGQAIRDAAQGGGGGGLSIAMQIAANFVDYDEFKRHVLGLVEQKLDENAGRVRLAAPRLGTFGAGLSRP